MCKLIKHQWALNLIDEVVKKTIFLTVISPSVMSGMKEIKMAGSGAIYELGPLKMRMHADDCHIRKYIGNSY